MKGRIESCQCIRRARCAKTAARVRRWRSVWAIANRFCRLAKGQNSKPQVVQCRRARKTAAILARPRHRNTMPRPQLPSPQTNGLLSAIVNMLASHVQFYSGNLVANENVVTDLSKYLPDTGTTMTFAQALASLRATCPNLAARGCIGTYLDSRFVCVDANLHDPINRLPLSLFNNPGDLPVYEAGPKAGQLVMDTDPLSYHVDFRKPASRKRLIKAILRELTSRKTAYGTQLVMFDNWIVGPENAGISAGNFYPITLADNLSYLAHLSAA